MVDRKFRQEQALIVSPDQTLSKELSAFLRKEEHFIPQIVNTPEEGLSALRFFLPALIIFDFDPGAPDNQEWLKLYREFQRLCTASTILLLHEEEKSQIQELNLQADAYHFKPVNQKALVRTANCLLGFEGRLSAPRKPKDLIFQIGQDLKLNFSSRQIQVGGRWINLTLTQFDLLVYLIKNADFILTKEEIIEAVWGKRQGSETLLKNCIWHLRNKLEKDPQNPEYILTCWGIGYYFRRSPEWL